MKKIAYSIASITLAAMSTSAIAGLQINNDNGAYATPAQQNNEVVLAQPFATSSSNTQAANTNAQALNTNQAAAAPVNATPAKTNSVANVNPRPEAVKTNATTDKAVTSKVKARYNDYDYLDPVYVAVSTENGVVRVDGNLEHDPEFEQAYFLAKTTDGVRAVDVERLEVRNSNVEFQDRETNAAIKVELYESGLVDGEDVSAWAIKTRTENGVVFVDGRVANENERLRVAEVIYATPSVEKVKTNVELY
jgi:osmotically-inducible protein OsmY